MNLQERIELMVRLAGYLKSTDPEWIAAKETAFQKNGWFIPVFIEQAINQVVENFLDKIKLEEWVNYYHINDSIQPKNVGIVMAGNIPLVGFHDFLAVFISGHYQTIKLSSKDDILLKHLVEQLYKMEPACLPYFRIAGMLKGCDAYIATGSNNSGRYFDQYFGKWPNIIRRNRTSVAILTGQESTEDLEKLADDIHLYFGLGCRNVTKIYVPENYDFVPLLNAFNKYIYFADHHKYKNNYDYQLSILLLNNVYYMTNGSTLVIQHNALFSPISQLNYEYYSNLEEVWESTEQNKEVQCIVGGKTTGFGAAQQPGLFAYADGVDTMQFLLEIG